MFDTSYFTKTIFNVIFLFEKAQQLLNRNGKHRNQPPTTAML